MNAAPKLTLCAIVKDQATLLGRLLTHHRDLYQEAVVVDTGSTDGSVEVARQLGARVGFFPWQDDFSAARNQALALAQGQWVLVLDCDELIDGKDFSALRALLELEPAGCFCLPQLNYQLEGGGLGWQPCGPSHGEFALGAAGFRTAWTVRLFPGQRGLRYAGVVHESLEDSALQAGLPLVQEEIPIHHQGHMLSREGLKSRRDLYGPLLARKIKEQPGDPRARYEMAVHLTAVAKYGLAERLLERTLGDHPEWGDAYRARLLLGEIMSGQGRLMEAVAQFQTAVEVRPDWPACWEAAIRGQLKLNRVLLASQYLAQARRLFPLIPAWDQFDAQVSMAAGR